MYFFSPQMLVLRLFPLRVLKPSSHRYKMIKFLTFDNLFSPLRVYEILAKTRSRMTMAKHLSAKMTLVHVLALLSTCLVKSRSLSWSLS